MALEATAWLALRPMAAPSLVTAARPFSLSLPVMALASTPSMAADGGAAQTLPRAVARGFPSWSGGRATHPLQMALTAAIIHQDAAVQHRCISGGDNISR
jgi:hypothetical protein